MKKITLLIIIQLFTIQITYLYAIETNSAYGEVISEEYNIVNGTFNFTIEYKFIDTVTFAYNKSTQFILPDGWSANIAPVIKGNVYYPEDTILLTVTVNYPVNNLPFYPKKISIIQFVTSDNTIEKEISTSAMVYFTPYNTIEIWNLQDFQNLPRRWFTPIENPDTTRIYIDPSNIPESNIDTSVYINWEIGDWEDDWQDEYREVKMQGLSYAVLMKPVPPDSVDYYKSIGDGPDSTNISGEKSKIFTGVVYGHLYTKINNDLGNPALVALTGIKVKLMDQDALWAETIETTYTDNHGYFEIHYSTNQKFEGEKMELFLCFKSRTNNDYQIHSTNLIGSNYKVYSEQISVPQNAGWNQIETILAYDESNYYDAFRTVHWANNGFHYFEAENRPLGKGLTIHINMDVIPFITGSFSMLGNIFLTDLAGDEENTPYHEFGHYTMYKLQSNNFTYPYGENGCADHRWDKENTSSLAWVEGWADAVQMILDAAYWQEDWEYGLEKFISRPYYEERMNYDINNGFRSEYYIACAIYDLWDGAGKGLPNTIPGFSIHGWNDSGQGIYGWKSVDDIELSFYNICKPLVDHPTGMQGYISGDKCMNIHDYYRYLVDNISDCNLKADISRVFRENRIQWNIAEYEWTWNVTNLSSDFIRQTEIKDESGYIILGGVLNSRNWTDNYLVNFYNKNSFNEFRYSAYSTQDLIISDNLWLGIWDTYSNVYKRSDLYLNDAVRYDYLGNPSEIHGNYKTCGGIEIDLKYGKLELGGGGKVNTTADLIITDKSLLRFRTNSNLNILTGSSIIIKEGGTIYIENNADIVLHDNSKIIVEPGGYICIEEGAVINLEVPNSIIELQPGALSGLNPALNITPSPICINPKDVDIIGQGQIIYICEDFADYTHYDETIVNYSDIWNTKVYLFKENLIITNNSELTINNSELQFAKAKKIIVEPGSKLILNNTKVTNLEQCGTMWQGIEVWGNRDLPQYPESNQGVVELKNGATIENARCAITTCQKDAEGNILWAYTGGIIHAKDANFINNLKAIEFLSYHNIFNDREIDNSSYFYNCTFETNAQLSDPGTLPETFVSLYNVKGVKFFGCTFQNTAPTGVYSTIYRGNGITSIDANYEVKPLCLSPYIYPCTEYQPNTFKNLYYGIYASNTNPAITLTINGNNFDNNHRSIILKSINNATITKNNFDIGATIGNINEPPYDKYDVFIPSYSYGVYLKECSGYKVEENNFSTTHDGHAGIIVNNSGTKANEIYS